ncbi:MAG: energy-coupling factor transporter transmembrane component T [Candidatus Binataceae bacterium]
MPIYRYIERTSFVHRLHPTVKVFALFIMFWSVYWVDNPLVLIPLALFLATLAQVTESTPNFYSLRWLFIILVFSTTVSWMLVYGSRGAWVTAASVKLGVGRGLKLANLLAASVLFLSTTKIEEFMIGLARLGVPYRARFVITLSFRLAPLFIDSFLSVVDAESLRGLDFSHGGVLTRIRRYVPVVIPVFMGALRKANNMAMALEARGFGMNPHPTSFIEYPVRPRDIATFVFLLALGAAYFGLYLTGLGAVAMK